MSIELDATEPALPKFESNGWYSAHSRILDKIWKGSAFDSMAGTGSPATFCFLCRFHGSMNLRIREDPRGFASNSPGNSEIECHCCW
jgi:hypothetical protein